MDGLVEIYERGAKEVDKSKQLVNIERVFEERELNCTILSLFTEEDTQGD